MLNQYFSPAGYSNSFCHVNEAGTPSWCAENVLKLGPFQSSPVPSGPFAWSRSLLFKGFKTVGEERSAFTRQGSLVQIQPRPRNPYHLLHLFVLYSS